MDGDVDRPPGGGTQTQTAIIAAAQTLCFSLTLKMGANATEKSAKAPVLAKSSQLVIGLVIII